MIISAEEFTRLRASEDSAEQYRAVHDFAEMQVWLDIINNYPDFKYWVIHNKQIPLEILELLSKDSSPEIRSAVARKRKINELIFNLLSQDSDEDVRYSLMCNTKLTLIEKQKIKVSDSLWLQQHLQEIIDTHRK